MVPCKDCVVKIMCQQYCDDLVKFIIGSVDSREINEDFYYYSINMASDCRTDPYLRKLSNG